MLVSGYKICGILSELLPDVAGRGRRRGAGLNLTLDEHDLPTLTSTSLLLVTGVQPDADAVLADYLGAIPRAVRATSPRPAATPPRAVSPPGERALRHPRQRGARRTARASGELLGRAERLDRDGRLVVVDRENGEPQAVAAGDVTHLRY